MTESPSFGAGLVPPAPVLSISQLNQWVRECLESAFPLCWVGGEVSNLTYASSGHAYFSLKDKGAQTRCVMFRNRAQLLGWRLENGQHIEARVLVTLYEARGDFQLNVETVRRAGIGNLYEQFLRLKEKLEREGLFSSESKRPLPAFPRRLGIVTSLQAAALRDVLTTLARRAPHVGIVLYPAPVQGEGAAAQIAAAINKASERRECDALILCRGGGSLEDLWAFNDEALARAIRNCRLPIISGIGHETDFTIADFAADRRAATPTAAAELAAPERNALENNLFSLQLALTRQIERQIERHSQQLDGLARRLVHPGEHLIRQRGKLTEIQRRLTAALGHTNSRRALDLARLSQLLIRARPNMSGPAAQLEGQSRRMHSAWQFAQSQRSGHLARIAASLGHLDPRAILARGYSIVTDESGNILSDSRALEPNDLITVSFHAGRAEAMITSVQH